MSENLSPQQIDVLKQISDESLNQNFNRLSISAQVPPDEPVDPSKATAFDIKKAMEHIIDKQCRSTDFNKF